MLTNGKDTEEISRQMWKRIYQFHKDISTPESFKEAGKLAKMQPELIEKAIAAIDQQELKIA